MARLVDRIRRHWTDGQSQHGRIARDFLLISLFVFVGKLASAGKEMAIAWRYGVSATVDAYVFIMSIVGWPVVIWGSILTVVLVPLAARLRSDNPAELPRFRSELLGLNLLLGLALLLGFWLVLPPLLSAGWLGLSGQALTEGLRMVGGLALLAPFGVIIGLLSTWLLAASRHRNTLFEAIPALVLLAFLLLPPGWMPEPLLWGTVAGFALQMAALGVPLRRCGELPGPQFKWRSPAWQFFWAGIGIMAVGQVMASGAAMVDQFLAAGLDAGALSTLGYASRVLALLMGLGATAISRATLPVFSSASAQGKDMVRTLAMYWAALMFALGLLVLLVMWVGAPLVVRVLFQRGAFTPDDTLAVASILRISLLQVPFYFPALVFVSALAAQRGHAKIALSGALNLVVKLPIALVLVRLFQLEGLVISTAAMYAISVILLYVMLRMHRGT